MTGMQQYRQQNTNLIWKCVCFCFCLMPGQHIQAQNKIDSIRFFLDEGVINITLTTDMPKLFNEKLKGGFQLAKFDGVFPDSNKVNEEIRISARGKLRREICITPPLKFNFHNPTSPLLYQLNSLKLVCGCRSAAYYEQLVIKEYLIYKMYNLFTDKSFRVRLVNITYEDSKKKKQTSNQYAFFIENIDALAKRNKCKELNNVKVSMESTNREHMTMIALFQYMIGNTDWSVMNNHNVKEIISKKDSASRPFVVPYDFDYSGLVNAEYAIPSEALGIEKVTDRIYRGYTRTPEEIKNALKLFQEKKDSVYMLINNCDILENSNKKEMVNYLDKFYDIINNKNQVEFIFIRNAVTQ